ncbi:MAG: RluA family pseudouridine synthase [Clostridiales Family XIII bacterium]|nr:RluA family pseudouridine synthase [Clostridiales Family XIII bacterium]
MMITLTITENEENQRLDRFLKKYLRNAPLSYVYKAIRKDVKLNGRRAKISDLLSAGDEVALYVSDAQMADFRSQKPEMKAKKQFQVAYEDENILIVEKPFGLLTHGDSVEKKNTLANQVMGYLSDQGAYVPGQEKTFVPSPVNRLDRNTTGLVLFGKKLMALQGLNFMIREKGYISKYYLTIVKGELAAELVLRDRMTKDWRSNTVRVVSGDAADGGADDGAKLMETTARPLASAHGYSLVEVELITGRTHQIRAHLAQAGFPVIGDPKYGSMTVNQKIEKRFGLSTQYLHANRLLFRRGEGELAYLGGTEVCASLPRNLDDIKNALFGAGGPAGPHGQTDRRASAAPRGRN